MTLLSMTLFKKIFTGSSKKQEPFFLAVSKIIGFRPKNISLYERVFTHRSLEMRDAFGKKVNYERLEFLGDAILGSIIAEFLYHELPEENEGKLTLMRSKIVRRDFLNNVGRALQLYPLLRSKVAKDRYGDDIHGNLLEALVGAIFVDMGYLSCVAFVKGHVIDPFVDLEKLEGKILSYKGLLVNWFQKHQIQHNFVVNEEQGLNDVRYYRTELYVDKKRIAVAKASNKKKSVENVSKRGYYYFQDKIKDVKFNY